MKSMTPSNLSNSFGHRSEVARKTIGELHHILANAGLDRELADTLEGWDELFQEVCGYKWDKINKYMATLYEHYSVPRNLEPNRVLLGLHTYYAMIVRWLTYNIVLSELDDPSGVAAFDPNSIQAFFDGIGIKNFGTNQYFDWYSPRATTRLLQCLEDLNQAFKQFDFSSVEDNGESDDLLKSLYQALFPRGIRHHLGEYYTPDWVAELTLAKAGYDFDLTKRILDPACGSGTFLVQILRGLLKNPAYVIDKRRLVTRVLKNVCGFDLNPLAVLSARANYLIAVRHLLPLENSSDIPVYQFDSVTTRNCDFSRQRELPLLDDQRNEELKIAYDVLPEDIWETSKFDFVVGNPPWINWKFLPEYYRQSVLPSAKKYNLFSHKGLRARLGFAQDDICVVLTYVAIDHFSKDGGILSFVLPQTLFKTVGGGEGFRQFRLGSSGAPFKLLSVVDLTRIKVFESVASKAVVFTCQKGKQTSYPIPYEIWSQDKGKRIHRFDSLEDVSKKVRRFIHLAEPIRETTSSWITADKDVLELVRKHIAPSDYRARAGVCGWASAVYWVKSEPGSRGLVRVQNYRQTARYKLREVTTELESELVYPLVRGRNIRRWHFDSDISIILPQSSQTPARAMAEELMKLNYPRTYSYLRQFKDFLMERKGYKKLLSGQPFYAVYDVGAYTFSHYKVAWKYLDTDMRAVVLDSTMFGKPLIPDLNVITISVDSDEEAHYIASCLNSSMMRLIVHTFGLCTRITPGVLSFLPIRRFSRSINAHKRLAELSVQCHSHYRDNLVFGTVMNEIDEIVLELLDIDRRQIPRIRENLDFYLGPSGRKAK